MTADGAPPGEAAPGAAGSSASPTPADRPQGPEQPEDMDIFDLPADFEMSSETDAAIDAPLSALPTLHLPPDVPPTPPGVNYAYLASAAEAIEIGPIQITFEHDKKFYSAKTGEEFGP